MPRAVFVDRDGVLNRALVRNGKPYAPRRLADFRLLPGAARAVVALKQAGFLVIVVTNQPDIGHGLIAPAAVEAMHERLRARIPVDKIMVCPHRQDENCACRKPKPGLLLDAAERWGIDLRQSYMIGDRWSDVVAGRTARVYTVLVDRGYSERLAQEPDARARSIADAVRIVLSHSA
jgi:D-glycero-D-manno-heptose 1,7-bisphosphate phosphatase